jgi:hypothetical protein
VPFFLMEVDGAGNRLRRLGSDGFPHTTFGGACAKLLVHDALAEPGRVLVEAVQTPEGATFLTIARSVDGPQGGWGERPRRTALLLGCDIAAADRLVYGASLPGPPTPVGPACRLCERAGCLARAEPPVTRPLGLDEMVTGLSAFDFR